MKKANVAVLFAALNCLIFTSVSVAENNQGYRGQISIKGKAFVDAAGKRFMIRGVALANSTDSSDDHVYDMLADTHFQEFNSRILPKLKELNVNTVRVYVIDLTKKNEQGVELREEHGKAMDALKKAGIYVSLELASPKYGDNLNRIAPQYTASLYRRYTAVIDEMAKYDNTLNFSLGNEVVFPGLIAANVLKKCQGGNGNEDQPDCIEAANKAITGDAAVLKSLARDMKAYIKKKGYRQIPVGVAMQDTPNTPKIPNSAPGKEDLKLIDTATVANYYACGDEPDQRMDFVALNAYRYTNQNTNVPQYVSIINDYHLDKMPVPFYLSETGGGNRPLAGVERDWATISWTYGLLGTLANSPGAQDAAKKYITNLSGEIPFMLLNWKEKAGLYDLANISGRDNASPFEGATDYGGAKLLAQQFAAVQRIDLPIFRDVPTKMSCPEAFKPDLLRNPMAGAKVSVTVKNDFGDRKEKLKNDVVVVQSGSPISTFNGSHDRMTVEAFHDHTTLIQSHPSKNEYYTICSVAGGTLKAGDIISSPQTEWGDKKACLIKTP